MPLKETRQPVPWKEILGETNVENYQYLLSPAMVYRFVSMAVLETLTNRQLRQEQLNSIGASVPDAQFRDLVTLTDITEAQEENSRQLAEKAEALEQGRAAMAAVAGGKPYFDIHYGYFEGDRRIDFVGPRRIDKDVRLAPATEPGYLLLTAPVAEIDGIYGFPLELIASGVEVNFNPARQRRGDKLANPQEAFNKAESALVRLGYTPKQIAERLSLSMLQYLLLEKIPHLAIVHTVEAANETYAHLTPEEQALLAAGMTATLGATLHRRVSHLEQVGDLESSLTLHHLPFAMTQYGPGFDIGQAQGIDLTVSLKPIIRTDTTHQSLLGLRNANMGIIEIMEAARS